MRTISGIANVAIMARPAPCGGGCIYCPKGKDAPQSYTGERNQPLGERSEMTTTHSIRSTTDLDSMKVMGTQLINQS